MENPSFSSKAQIPLPLWWEGSSLYLTQIFLVDVRGHFLHSGWDYSHMFSGATSAAGMCQEAGDAGDSNTGSTVLG